MDHLFACSCALYDNQNKYGWRPKSRSSELTRQLILSIIGSFTLQTNTQILFSNNWVPQKRHKSFTERLLVPYMRHIAPSWKRTWLRIFSSSDGNQPSLPPKLCLSLGWIQHQLLQGLIFHIGYQCLIICRWLIFKISIDSIDSCFFQFLDVLQPLSNNHDSSHVGRIPPATPVYCLLLFAPPTKKTQHPGELTLPLKMMAFQKKSLRSITQYALHWPACILCRQQSFVACDPACQRRPETMVASPVKLESMGLYRGKTSQFEDQETKLQWNFSENEQHAPLLVRKSIFPTNPNGTCYMLVLRRVGILGCSPATVATPFTVAANTYHKF